ncbi:MAG: serine hydrolase domain-containing protein, partial [Blastocatellia bacterium]
CDFKGSRKVYAVCPPIRPKIGRYDCMNRPSSVYRYSFIALVLAVVLSPGQSAAVAQDKASRIDTLVSAYQKAGKFNGSVLAAERDEVIFSKGYGWADLEWDIPNTSDTKFRLGSITKQFTSMLIMQLVSEGKVKLDGKLSDFLPYYRKDTGDRITIQNLLTHTSGIPNYTALSGFFQNVSRNPFGVEDFIKKYCSGDLRFEPGSKFEYDNSGYFLLGAVIEQVTGKPYEQVLKERILDPLGMKDTGYDHHETILKKRAQAYEKTPKGFVNAGYLDMSIPYAAGSLYSTVEDLYKWDQALYTSKLLPDEYKKKMFTPFLEHYAFGWFVSDVPVGASGQKVSTVSHEGGINGFNTLIIRFVDDHDLIVLLNNTGGAPLEEMARQITNILYDKPFKLPAEAPAK